MHQKLVLIRQGKTVTQHVEPLPDGIIGNRRSLEILCDWVRTDCLRVDIVERARRVCAEAGVRGHDTRAESEALFRYARDEIVYRQDPAGSEWLQDASYTSAAKAGDCDDKITWYATHAAALRHVPCFVTLSYDGGLTYAHVFGAEYVGKDYAAFLKSVQEGKEDLSELLFVDPTPGREPLGWRAKGFKQFLVPIF